MRALGDYDLYEEPDCSVLTSQKSNETVLPIGQFYEKINIFQGITFTGTTVKSLYSSLVPGSVISSATVRIIEWYNQLVEQLYFYFY